jgi:serine/threonine protein kinase/Tfp pilus assembly protein PilF
MIGQVISHYEVLEKVGEGAMGVVYKARDTKLGRTVALKFLPSRLHGSEADRARFLQEARSAAILNHPNVCVIHDIREEAGQHFIVMEYVEGVTLGEKIRAGAIDVDHALGYARQIGEALQEAHAKGIVHRDVKPENIMVNERNQVKVMDFGLAKLKGSVRLTQNRATVGTVAYMAPEQLQGVEADARSDIFAFGVVFYEMLAGRLPFRGEHEAAIMYSIMHEDPVPLATLRGDLPGALEPVIDRMLAKQAAARFPAAADVLRALAEVQAGDSSHGKTESMALAVLPFSNIGGQQSEEYFSDGLTEEVITNLSRIRSLRVVSRITVMRYKGSIAPLQQIAAELQVQYILEGTVRKQGNDVRITAQLVDARRDSQLWAEKYKGTLDDIFQIQEEVAEEIVEALRVQLSPTEATELKKRATANPEAYQSFLNGRHQWNKRTRSGFHKAIEYLGRAVDLDANYSQAHAAIADCYNLLGAYDFMAPADAQPKALAAAERALRLDGNLAEAHEALAHVRMLYEWNWPEVERGYRDALVLNPDYATAHQRQAIYFAAMERYDEARRAILRASQLEPFSLIINTDVALIHMLRGEHEDALRLCARALELDPHFTVGHFVLGLTQLAIGRPAEAVESHRKAMELSEGHTVYTTAYLHALAVAGRAEEARSGLRRLMERSDESTFSPYGIATVHAGLNEDDAALAMLSRAVERRSVWLIHLHAAIDVRLASVRRLDGYANLRLRMGFPR